MKDGGGLTAAKSNKKVVRVSYSYLSYYKLSAYQTIFETLLCISTLHIEDSTEKSLSSNKK